MDKFNMWFLRDNRMGNTANDKEWKIITNWLSTGQLNSKEEMQVCLDNIKKNKKWYYALIRNYKTSRLVTENDKTITNGDLYILRMIGIAFITTIITGFAYAPFMNDIIAKIINFQSDITLTASIPDIFDIIIWALANAGISISIPNVYQKIAWDSKIDNLQEALENGLEIEHSNKASRSKTVLVFKTDPNLKSDRLKKYVDKELADRGTNQNAEIEKEKMRKMLTHL